MSSILEAACSAPISFSSDQPARLGGRESPFGREFDSLADVVSFGLAPALLVYQVVLQGFPRAGWLIAFAYLLCGTLRLARGVLEVNATRNQLARSLGKYRNLDRAGLGLPARDGDKT